MQVSPGVTVPLQSPRALSEAELVDLVLLRTGTPIDRWAVTAVLEAEGLRDVDAVEGYGKPDLFALAIEIYDACLAQNQDGAPAPQRLARPPRRRRIARALALYARGASFFVPLVIQVVSLVVLGYGLWVSLRFDNAQMTVIALATILSLLTTDGFGQAIGRAGSIFEAQDKHTLVPQMVVRIFPIGLVGALALGAVAWTPFFLLGGYSRHLGLVGFAYYALLCPLWLSLATLYMLRRQEAIALSALAGVGVVVAFKEGAGLDIYISQWIGLVASSVVAGAWGGLAMRRRARSVHGDLRLARLPQRPLLIAAVAPSFAYGILYYTFLFADRLVAWTSGSTIHPIEFQTPYELGLDWALASIVPAIAVLEYTVSRLGKRLAEVQEQTPGSDMRLHNVRLQGFYVRHVALLAAFAVGGALAVDRLVETLRGVRGVPAIHDFFANQITFDVHTWAAFSYGLLALGLLNAVFLTAMSRPGVLAWGLGISVAVDVGIGVWLSHAGPYWHSVIGLLAGAFTFAGITTAFVLHLLGRADYYTYSAY